MLYNRLLISAGGGILSPSQQLEQTEQATIAIGFGGTGISCLRTLKKEIYNRVRPDDEISEIAKYKHIKFMAVDTDAFSLASKGSIDSLDENKIAKAASDYFLAQLEEHTSKTIDDYLRVKFNTTEPSVLQTKIY